MLAEFSQKNWKKEWLNILLKKIWETGSAGQRHESSKNAHTAVNVTAVKELVLGQEDQTQRHRSTSHARYPERRV